MPLFKHVVAKVILVPCSVNFILKSGQCWPGNVGHGEVAINNAVTLICLFTINFLNSFRFYRNINYNNMVT